MASSHGNLATLAPRRRGARVERPRPVRLADSRRTPREHPREQHLGESLRCVSSGYLSDGCSCQATIPAAVVADAWTREQQLAGVRQDGFFHFAWRGGVWLAYGLGDGGVRGVYCPAHSAERAVRSFVHSAGAAC